MRGLFQFRKALFKFVLHYDAGGPGGKEGLLLGCFDLMYSGMQVLLFESPPL